MKFLILLILATLCITPKFDNTVVSTMSSSSEGEAAGSTTQVYRYDELGRLYGFNKSPTRFNQ